MYPIIAKIIRIVIAITCPNSTKRKYSVNTLSFIINNKRNKININKSRLNWKYDISLAKFHFDYYKRLLNKNSACRISPTSTIISNTAKHNTIDNTITNALSICGNYYICDISSITIKFVNTNFSIDSSIFLARMKFSSFECNISISKI